MIEESEAYQLLDEHILTVTTTVDCPIDQSLGRVAAADLYSQLPLPRFANSMVDGYAVRDCPLQVGATLRLVGEQPAGVDRGLSLSPGETIRIFTGAPLPAGTQAVIMQEAVSLPGDDSAQIGLREAITAGEGIRQVGDDLCTGQKILSGGDRLTPQRLALLASLSHETVPVRPHPRVHVISTGDEVKPLGAELAPGELYESNALMLCLLGQQQGWLGWTRAHIADDRRALEQAIASAVAHHDFLFLSGGVSVGDHDHVRPALLSLGMEEHFWRVRVQPGKPVLFGALDGCHVLGLPGNPVSSFVSFHLFGIPALHHWLGLPRPPRLRASLEHQADNAGPRPHYLRGQFDEGSHTFRALGLQKSHGTLALSLANALARIPPGTELSEGDEVEVLLI